MDLMPNKYMDMATEFAEKNDLNSLAPGRHDIDGDNCYVNIVETKLRPAEQAKLEAHDKYIDVQIPLSGSESFGTKPRFMCTAPEGEMDPVNDIMFFSDPIEEIVTVEAGQTIVFPPFMAHAPLIGEGPIRKAIFKVKAEE